MSDRSSLDDNPEVLPTVELKGYAPLWRVKYGEYRIIYKIDGDILRVTLIGKRNDDEIYRLIKRFLRYSSVTKSENNLYYVK